MVVFFCICGLLCLILLWVALYDTMTFSVSGYEYRNENIKQPKKAVVLSDLHNRQFGKDNALLLQAIRREEPDMVLIAGDMITAKPHRSMKKTLAFLQKLSESYPVYFARGNHEQRLKLYPEVYESMAHELEQALSEYGVCVLENDCRMLPESGICLYGLEMDREYYKRRHAPKMEKAYLNETLGEAKDGCCNVLLAHNPEYFEAYAAWGAHLVLSGHVHGGVVRVPIWNKGIVSPSLRLFPKYDGGVFEKDKATMIISRGLGIHTIPFRLFNRGELLAIDFLPKTEETEEK